MNTWGHSRASLSPPRDCVSMRGKKARGSERRLTLTLFYLELLLGMKECQESTTAVCWELMCWRRRRSNFQWEASRVCVISLLCLNGGKCWKGVIHHRPISGCNQWWTQDVWGHGAKQNKKKGHTTCMRVGTSAQKSCAIFMMKRGHLYRLLEGHPRGQFIMCYLPQGRSRGYWCCVFSKHGAPEGWVSRRILTVFIPTLL